MTPDGESKIRQIERNKKAKAGRDRMAIILCEAAGRVNLRRMIGHESTARFTRLMIFWGKVTGIAVKQVGTKTV